MNLLGCVAFGISAVAAYVVPSTGSAIDLAAANAFTALGALGFLIGALLLLPGDASPAPDDAERLAARDADVTQTQGASHDADAPEGPSAPTRDLSVLPIFELEGGGRIPRHEMPENGMPAGRRLPDHPRRADARRQRAHEPRDVRDDVDGAAGRQAHGRVLRQEHDRQGRVSADRGARDALRQHAQPALARRAGAGDGLLDDGLERGGDARRARAQAALAEAARGRGQADRQAEPRDGHQRPGLLGEVRELLGRRDAARADGGRPLHTSRPRRPSKRCDENTIGVVAILGSTFDGAYEPVAEICAALDDLQERTGLDVPVHVDGASGAFVAPFVDPDLEWDFRLPRVVVDQHVGAQVRARLPGRRLGRSGATPRRCPRT